MRQQEVKVKLTLSEGYEETLHKGLHPGGKEKSGEPGEGAPSGSGHSRQEGGGGVKMVYIKTGGTAI